jgi:drug/metabolite transporter (DMT)-like permease
VLPTRSDEEPYSLWSVALACNPLSRVAVFGFMNPVFGVILSALLLNEGSVLDPATAIISLVLVSAGIIIVNRPAKEPKPAKA